MVILFIVIMSVVKVLGVLVLGRLVMFILNILVKKDSGKNMVVIIDSIYMWMFCWLVIWLCNLFCNISECFFVRLRFLM